LEIVIDCNFYKIEANEADQLSLKKKIEDLASSKVLLESEARALDLEILVRVDISAIEQDLINAKSINERVEAHVKCKEYLNEVNTLIGESDMLTDTLNDYDEQKKELIKSAKLPVDKNQPCPNYLHVQSIFGNRYRLQLFQEVPLNLRQA
jgi:hypothetical protein